MSRIAGGLIVLLLSSYLVFGAARVSDEVTLKHLIVHETRPERLIKHEVDWQGAIETTRRRSMLVGPRRLSTELSDGGAASEKMLFGWYELSAQPRVHGRVTAWSSDGTKSDYKLGHAAYLLATTQQLEAGAPADIPESLGHYMAYTIIDASHRPRELTLPSVKGPTKYRLSKPVFICLPIEEWHHHEHFPTSSIGECWVVYETSAIQSSEVISTLDQFGLNKLRLASANWICIPSPKFHISDPDS